MGREPGNVNYSPRSESFQSEDATYVGMFSSIDPDLSAGCLTPQRIGKMCQSNPGWFDENREKRRAIFLFKKDDVIFVARVMKVRGILSVMESELLGDSTIWKCENHFRIIFGATVRF